MTIFCFFFFCTDSHGSRSGTLHLISGPFSLLLTSIPLNMMENGKYWAKTFHSIIIAVHLPSWATNMLYLIGNVLFQLGRKLWCSHTVTWVYCLILTAAGLGALWTCEPSFE